MSPSQFSPLSCLIFFFSGKIRVFCRIRPLSRTEDAQGGVIAVEKIDDFSVSVDTPRGPREFQFDKVFTAEASQEDLFQDTNRWGGGLCLLSRDQYVYKCTIKHIQWALHKQVNHCLDAFLVYFNSVIHQECSPFWITSLQLTHASKAYF